MNKTTQSTTGLRAVALAAALAAALACGAGPSFAGDWPWSGEQVQGSGSVKRQAR